MNKSELAEKLSDELGISKQDSLSILNSVLDGITTAIAAGEKIKLSGFGCFEPKKLKQRGSPFGENRSASMSVSFRPGVRLLEAAALASERIPSEKQI